jgi:hypothetical protein
VTGTASAGSGQTAQAYVSDGRAQAAAARREAAACAEFAGARTFAFWAARLGLRANAETFAAWQAAGQPW